MPTKAANAVIARINKLEENLEKHLIESGEIRSDLTWLKKAFWLLSGCFLTGTVALLVQVALLLLRK
jgi:uncharacterized membrane protein